MVIMSSVFPAIVSSKMQSEDLYYRRLQFVLGILLWMAVIVAVFISLFAKFILVGFFGSAYLPAAGVLALHAWACIFVYLGVAGTRWLINENLQFFSMAYTALGAICNIALNFLLIPRYSILGAALATVIAQFIAAVLANSLDKRTRKIFELQIKAFNIANIFKVWSRLI
jgi:PST family polysaccharide transporter